jgi:hypothetical protein
MGLADVISISVGVLGLGVGIIVPLKSRGKRRLAWGSATIPRPGDSRLTFILIRNEGNRTLTTGDVVKPLAIRPADDGHIALAAVQWSDDDTSEARIADGGKVCLVQFSVLEPRQQVMVSLTHSGPPELKVEGRVAGVPKFARLAEGYVRNLVFSGSATTPIPSAAAVAGMPAVDSASPLVDGASAMLSTLNPEQLKAFAATRALELTLAREQNSDADHQAQANAVRFAVSRANVFALGEPAGNRTEHGGSESDLLHFTVDDPDGTEKVMLPLFSAPDYMAVPLQRNPEWQSMSVLQLDGDETLRNVDPDVTVVINPWSRLEFQLPPLAQASDPSDGSAEQPSQREQSADQPSRDQSPPAPADP